MSNSAIAQRILEVVTAFEGGQVSAVAIAQSIELHESALESIPKDIREAMHKLSVKIIQQDVSQFEESLLGLQASREACQELKRLLKSIT